jgi:hypothetical protein
VNGGFGGFFLGFGDADLGFADGNFFGCGIRGLKPSLTFADLRTRQIDLCDRLAVDVLCGNDRRFRFVNTRTRGVNLFVDRVELGTRRL